MRASKNSNQMTEDRQIHISGAEGIYNESEILKIVREYTTRALNHPRGKPDSIVITLEKIRQIPEKAKILPVTTLDCDSPERAMEIIYEKLFNIGIPKRVITNALNIVTSKMTMRGASLISIKSGKRMEPDKDRGVRVSRLGINRIDRKRLSQRLSAIGLNKTIVKEALILASKVANQPDIVAEICISDDPDYTTGYIASKHLGYLRIPNIKKQGQMHGGRVFFLKDDADIERVIRYLEKTPVLVKV